jgi:hypothetical protein
LKSLREVGHYSITTPISSESLALLGDGASSEGEQIARRFVVHLDPRLSNLRSETQSDREDNEASAPLVGALAQRSELWHLGLLGLFVFALLEGITLFQRREDRVSVTTR